MAINPQQTLNPTPRPIPDIVDTIRGIASRHWMHQESSSIVDLCDELDRSFASLGAKPSDNSQADNPATTQRWNDSTPKEIAWLGLQADMSSMHEIADWLNALVNSGGCGHLDGDAFASSSNALATWVSSLADKIRQVAQLPPNSPAPKNRQPI